MDYTSHIPSPLGTLTLASDGTDLTGLWMEGQKHFGRTLSATPVERPSLPVFVQTQQWLDAYFEGHLPAAQPSLAPRGTAFQQCVWQVLREVPFGQTVTYGALAREVARRLGRSQMSARAVGAAVGQNPISVLVPCHRVVGSDGRLTGYAGGLDRKQLLLQLERDAVANAEREAQNLN